jgi:hypothetical protein
MTRRLTAALMTSLVVCAAVCLASDETLSGYDAWRFGMTTGEVAQVKELGPYSPVPATGGLETKNGRFLGEKTNISFIFGPHGLRRIQIWVYEGHDTEAAIKAFYSTYKHRLREVPLQPAARVLLGISLLRRTERKRSMTSPDRPAPHWRIARFKTRSPAPK